MVPGPVPGSVTGTGTGPTSEIRYRCRALSPVPVPDPPVKSGTGAGLCHRYRDRYQVYHENVLIKLTLEYMDLLRKYTYNLH